MKKFFSNIYILFFVFALFCNIPSITLAAETTKSSSSSNCSEELAKLYFNTSDVDVSSYSPEYYCSDILYLTQSQDGQAPLGNIPIDEYKKLYPTEAQGQFSYLRKIGITPNIFAEDRIPETAYEYLSSKDRINELMKSYVGMMRGDFEYIITTYSDFEPDPDLFDAENVGAILNKNKKYRECSEPDEDIEEIENSLYSFSNNYTKYIKALPKALAPVVLDGNRLINTFGNTVAILKDNRALGKKKRQVTFSSVLLSQASTVTIDWNEKVCRPKSIQEMVNKNSTCYLCPYIIMVFNEISYLFDYMYTHFSKTILVFLVVFGALWMLFEFLKGFNKLPFTADFSYYPKSVAKRLQKIIIVCTIFLVPPQTLFSWTVAPVMDLTIAISDTIMGANKTNSETSACIGSTIVDELNKERENEYNEIATPPIIKIGEQKSIEALEESYIIPKETMGNIICFLTDTLRANGRQMTIGEVLMRNLFKPSTQNSLQSRILGFIFGVIIFGLYFAISLMISFYILDGLLEFLLLAVTWPFAVFGYAFDLVSIKVSVSSLIDMTKKYGLILINLAVFTLFNSALLNSFYFMNMDERTYEVLQGANLDILKDKDNDGIPFNVPIEGYTMTSEFGDRSDPFMDEADIHATQEFHTGIDFAVPLGTPIPSSAKGHVVQAGERGNYGNAVEVQHEGGFSTVYGHLSKVSVSVGEVITAGTIIGLSGSTGRSTGPHLHYEVRYNGNVINPLTFTNRRETVTEIINRAVEENDESVITNSIPIDLQSVLKFLFIIYCIYYIYANLGTLAERYGGNAGSTPIGSSIRSLMKTSIKTVTSVSRIPLGDGYYVKQAKKDKKDKSKNNGKPAATPTKGGKNG